MKLIGCPGCGGALNPWHWPFAQCTPVIGLGCGLVRLDEGGDLPAPVLSPAPDVSPIVQQANVLTGSTAMDESGWHVVEAKIGQPIYLVSVADSAADNIHFARGSKLSRVRWTEPEALKNNPYWHAIRGKRFGPPEMDFPDWGETA